MNTQNTGWSKAMFVLALMGAGVLRCGAAEPAGPTQLVVLASEAKKCSATLFPGTYEQRADFAAVFPGALLIYEGPVAIDASGLLYQSCQIMVSREQFLEKFSSCAVALVDKGNGCSVSFTGAGGRFVEISAANAEGHKPAETAFCSFVCVPAVPPAK